MFFLTRLIWNNANDFDMEEVESKSKIKYISIKKYRKSLNRFLILYMLAGVAIIGFMGYKLIDESFGFSEYALVYLVVFTLIFMLIHVIFLKKNIKIEYNDKLITLSNSEQVGKQYRSLLMLLLSCSVIATIIIPDFVGFLFFILVLIEIISIRQSMSTSKAKLADDAPNLLDKVKDILHIKGFTPDPDFFIPETLRKLTIYFIYGFNLIWGGLVLILALNPFYFILGVGELVLYFILKHKWYSVKEKLEKQKMSDVQLEPISYGRYVLITYTYAMLMEFCVDFGAYSTLNPLLIIAIMAGLTPHYFMMATIIRLWFKWDTYTPREMYIIIGFVGYLIEVVILTLLAGTFEIGLALLLIVLSYPVHALNYGGFVVIPTLYQNQTDDRKPTTGARKYVTGIVGTILLTIPALLIVYGLLFRVI